MKLLLTFLIINISNISFANNLALPCYGCHISNDKTPTHSIPLIEGIDKEYFISAIYEYKNKVRSNYLMQIISQGYSDKEIVDLAEYFSNKVTVKNDK